MKKETIIAAIAFFGAGFLSGYIYDAQKNWSARQREASRPLASPGQPAGAATGGMGQSLPEGHPALETSAVVAALEEEAARNITDPTPRLKLANYFYDQNQWLKAIEWYQKTLELDPKNVNAHTDLGTAYFNVGQPRDALGEYAKSLELDPQHEPTLFNSIVVNMEGTRDLEAAQRAWDRLHKLDPNYPGLDRLKQRLEAARGSGPGASVRP